MWYIELIIMTGLIALFTQSVIFVDFASEEQKVNNEEFSQYIDECAGAFKKLSLYER
jgi:hypothetical protein